MEKRLRRSGTLAALILCLVLIIPVTAKASGTGAADTAAAGTAVSTAASPASDAAAYGLPQDAMDELNALAATSEQQKEKTLGYPGNENLELSGFYDWYTSSGLSETLLNNAGDPFSPHGTLNSLEIEQKVIKFFAPMYGIDPENVWGLVTASGTDGNNHGIYFGAKLLKNKTGMLPVVYVSTESHYSNKRLADLQNLEVRLIDCDAMGNMKPEALKKALDPKRPALIVYSMGTTFKGGIDDQAALNAVIDEVKPVAVYRHVDAALFGGYLPYTAYKDLVDRTKYPFDSIAISGHKFFGMDEPCGLFLTTGEVLDAQDANNVSYLNASMPMINCSRSAINPLKFYWIINKVGKQGFTAQAAQMLNNAAYLKCSLDNIGWPAWKGECSNTVFFKRPSEEIMEKYSLAPDYDAAFGGNLAHVVVMQHVDKELIDEFVADLKTSAVKP
jgi:histidine decarboxylase